MSVFRAVLRFGFPAGLLVAFVLAKALGPDVFFFCFLVELFTRSLASFIIFFKDFFTRLAALRVDFLSAVVRLLVVFLLL